MATTIEQLIEGGKASAAPPLGPALGPIGVNIGLVIAEINKKTADFKGMQVPVKIVVDDDKNFTISVGAPSTSSLIKSEAKLESGSGSAKLEKVANMRIEQMIKISKMKADNLQSKDAFSRVKEVIGTCQSMGVMIEGLEAKDAIAAINEGKWKAEISAGKSELSTEDLKKIEIEKQALHEEVEKRRTEYTATAKSIIEKFAGKARAEIKAKLLEAKVPLTLINELLPGEKKAEPGAPGAAAAAPGAAAAAPAKK